MSDVVVVDEASTEVVRDAQSLIDDSARTDGQSPLSEQGRLQLRGGRRAGVRHLLLRQDGELVGYAQLEDTDPVEPPTGELAVHPSHRGRGYGRQLGQALLKESGKRLRVWAHGGHPAARHLAQVLGLSLFRELRQMRRPLTEDGPQAAPALPEPVLPEGVTVRTFRPGEDDEEWLALNASSFAHHPEQGSLTQRDLDDRKAQPWFDPSGFFLAEREGRLVGFHWTKVHTPVLGEVYVVGVDPDAQGGGLGRALTLAGLQHLREQQVKEVMLYVESDNAPAVRVYTKLGFTLWDADVQYAR
jgi:mycothiol synthase